MAPLVSILVENLAAQAFFCTVCLSHDIFCLKICNYSAATSKTGPQGAAVECCGKCLSRR
ncbi:hypothetical protein SAMN05660860_03299 [Geoalkalibacter ferrihydriticus]|uniref:Uncharacterized protein n=1 Tax=Geoalkalibacter ferrihydriticus TaxID=392333 RepID=A0A1G9WNQ3_9BACT|nr:hypothetical protein SAMN05660860_03299 [Geoalkalibacter ferrihydriticus]